MKELMRNLIKLQALDFSEIKDKNTETATAELRGKIPPQILGHYDRLVVRGKKGVALIRNQVCTGCHMFLPVAVVATLKRGEDIQLCDSCGRYLYLAEEENAPALEQPAAPAKPSARKPRKRKTPIPDA